MQKLRNIDEQTNILTWFEIPVTNINRAQKFYEIILDIKMVKRADGKDEATFFPFDPNVIQATSGRVTGVLSKSEQNPVTVMSEEERFMKKRVFRESRKQKCAVNAFNK